HSVKLHQPLTQIRVPDAIARTSLLAVLNVKAFDCLDLESSLKLLAEVYPAKGFAVKDGRFDQISEVQKCAVSATGLLGVVGMYVLILYIVLDDVLFGLPGLQNVKGTGEIHWDDMPEA